MVIHDEQKFYHVAKCIQASWNSLALLNKSLVGTNMYVVAPDMGLSPLMKDRKDKNTL